MFSSQIPNSNGEFKWENGCYLVGAANALWVCSISTALNRTIKLLQSHHVMFVTINMDQYFILFQIEYRAKIQSMGTVK